MTREMDQSEVDDLCQMGDEYRDSLRALWDECKGDEREFGRMVARFADFPLTRPNIPFDVPAGV